MIKRHRQQVKDLKDNLLNEKVKFLLLNSKSKNSYLYEQRKFCVQLDELTKEHYIAMTNLKDKLKKELTDQLLDKHTNEQIYFQFNNKNDENYEKQYNNLLRRQSDEIESQTNSNLYHMGNFINFDEE